jgi:hypothetical protein
MFTYTRLHTSSYYSAVDVCISRLVEFELLFELKFEQKYGTSLVKLVLSRRKSRLPTERLSVPVILGEYCARIHSEHAIKTKPYGKCIKLGGLDVETFTLKVIGCFGRSAVAQRVYHLMKIETGFKLLKP